MNNPRLLQTAKGMVKSMKHESEFKPVDKLPELQFLLSETKFEFHREGDEDEEYQYLKKGDVCITVQNPYQSAPMFIDLNDEFTLTYGAYHDHYYPDLQGYEEMVSNMQGILKNEICLAALYYGSEKRWLGSTGIAKSQLMRPVKEIFDFVWKQSEFRKNLKDYGGEAQFCFWNPVDDRIIKIPKGS